MLETFVTTLDNPYDYFTQFDQWYAFDQEKGYNTCAYLARISLASTSLSEYDYLQAIEDACDEIVRMNLTGNYRKIAKGKDGKAVFGEELNKLKIELEEENGENE